MVEFSIADAERRAFRPAGRQPIRTSNGACHRRAIRKRLAAAWINARRSVQAHQLTHECCVRASSFLHGPVVSHYRQVIVHERARSDGPAQSYEAANRREGR